MASEVTMLLTTKAAIVIDSPIAEYIIVRLARSSRSGWPELTIYLNPPATKKPVATKPANPARTWITLFIKLFTLVTPAASASAGWVKSHGSPSAIMDDISRTVVLLSRMPVTLLKM